MKALILAFCISASAFGQRGAPCSPNDAILYTGTGSIGYLKCINGQWDSIVPAHNPAPVQKGSNDVPNQHGGVLVWDEKEHKFGWAPAPTLEDRIEALENQVKRLEAQVMFLKNR